LGIKGKREVERSEKKENQRELQKRTPTQSGDNLELWFDRKRSASSTGTEKKQLAFKTKGIFGVSGKEGFSYREE